MGRKGTSTTLAPKITFEQALTSRFVLAGRTYEVRSCSVETLRALVRSGLSNTKQVRSQKQIHLLGLLRMLETDVDEMTRWYVIEELLTLKVKIAFAA